MQRIGIEVVAQRRVHHAVLLQHGLAGEGIADDDRLEMTPVSADADVGIRQTLKDKAFYFFRLQFSIISSSRAAW